MDEPFLTCFLQSLLEPVAELTLCGFSQDGAKRPYQRVYEERVDPLVLESDRRLEQLFSTLHKLMVAWLDLMCIQVIQTFFDSLLPEGGSLFEIGLSVEVTQVFGAALCLISPGLIGAAQLCLSSNHLLN